MDYITLISTRSLLLAQNVPIPLWCLLNNDAEAYRQVHAHLLCDLPSPSHIQPSTANSTLPTTYHQYQSNRLSPPVVRQAEEQAWAQVCKGKDVLRALGDWFGAAAEGEKLSEDMFIKIASMSGIAVVEQHPHAASVVDEPTDGTRLIFC
jgi:hypothetical protein